MGVDRRDAIKGLLGATGASGLTALYIGVTGDTDGDPAGSNGGKSTDGQTSGGGSDPGQGGSGSGRSTGTTAASLPGRPLDGGATVAGREWTARTTDRGQVRVLDGDGGSDGDESGLWFRVYRCNRAVAATDLGRVSGTLSVAFDWTFRAEGWYESDLVAVDVAGETVPLTADRGIDKEPRSETTGRYRGRATVDGPATLRLGLVPSDHCSNGDHGDSTLVVRNLSVTVEESASLGRPRVRPQAATAHPSGRR